MARATTSGAIASMLSATCSRNRAWGSGARAEKEAKASFAAAVAWATCASSSRE